MDIPSLHAFIAVADNESFSKASEQLHLTQPAISKRVASLEEELGTQLFNRIARHVSLTDAGRQLLPKALQLVQQAEDMQRFASTLSGDMSGTLSIAMAHHIGLHRMPPILRKFSQKYPRATLDLRFEDSEIAFAMVEKGEIEFSVITLPNELPRQLEQEVLWHDELVIVVGEKHRLSQYNQIDTSMLSKFACVLPGSETETYKVIEREFKRANLELNVQMQTNNLETLKMLTAAGLGWSLLPKTMLDKSLINIGYSEKLERKLGLVRHKRRSFSNLALAFQEVIYQAIKG